MASFLTASRLNMTHSTMVQTHDLEAVKRHPVAIAQQVNCRRPFVLAAERTDMLGEITPN